MLQAANADLIAEQSNTSISTTMASVRRLASMIGYEYRLVTYGATLACRELPPCGNVDRARMRTPDDCVYTAKVAAILRAHRDLPTAPSMLLYVDLDVDYTACETRALDDLLPAQAPDGSACQLIAQDTRIGVHTGVVGIMHGPAGGELLRAWLDEQRKLSVCEGSADQIALQMVIARRLIQIYNVSSEEAWFKAGRRGDGLMQKRTHSWTPRLWSGHGDCSSWVSRYWSERNYKMLQWADFCFSDVLETALDMRPGNRSRQGVCLISFNRSVAPMQLSPHDYHGLWRPGDAFFHHHAHPLRHSQAGTFTAAANAHCRAHAAQTHERALPRWKKVGAHEEQPKVPRGLYRINELIAEG